MQHHDDDCLRGLVRPSKLWGKTMQTSPRSTTWLQLAFLWSPKLNSTQLYLTHRNKHKNTSCRRAAATTCLRPCKLTISSYLFARWHLLRHVGYLRHQQQVDLWPFDLESGVRFMCDVGYLYANFSLPRPLCSRVRPNVHERQIDQRQTDRGQTSGVRQKHRLIGIIRASYQYIMWPGQKGSVASALATSSREECGISSLPISKNHTPLSAFALDFRPFGPHSAASSQRYSFPRCLGVWIKP